MAAPTPCAREAQKPVLIFALLFVGCTIRFLMGHPRAKAYVVKTLRTASLSYHSISFTALNFLHSLHLPSFPGIISFRSFID